MISIIVVIVIVIVIVGRVDVPLPRVDSWSADCSRCSHKWLNQPDRGRAVVARIVSPIRGKPSIDKIAAARSRVSLYADV